MKKLTTVAVVVLGLGTAVFASGMGGEHRGMRGGDGECGGMKQHKAMKLQREMGEQRGMGYQKHRGMQNGMKQNSQATQNRMFYIIKKLNLTDDQKAKMRDIRRSKRADQKAFKLERKAFKLQQRAAKIRKMDGMDLSKFMTVDKFDKDAFRAMLTKKMDEKRAKMEKMRTARINTKIDSMEKVFNLLTPEQRVELIEQSKR